MQNLSLGSFCFLWSLPPQTFLRIRSHRKRKDCPLVLSSVVWIKFLFSCSCWSWSFVLLLHYVVNNTWKNHFRWWFRCYCLLVRSTELIEILLEIDGSNFGGSDGNETLFHHCFVTWLSIPLNELLSSGLMVCPCSLCTSLRMLYTFTFLGLPDPMMVFLIFLACWRTSCSSDILT